MIKVSVFYPKGPQAKFGMDYYCQRHILMVQRLVGAALPGTAVEKGLAGASPGAVPSFLAVGHLTFDSVESFQASFGAHTQEIVDDVPNYTNVQPIIQLQRSHDLVR